MANITELEKEGILTEEFLHSKDATGAEIERALSKISSMEINDNLKIYENWMAVDLIQKKYGEPGEGIVGLWCLSPVWYCPYITC